MERNFRILSLGVGGITVILGFVFQYKINELFFVLPILILANSYRYKAETAAILNAGEYICKIENSIYRQNSCLGKCDTDKVFGDLGWENYLRNEMKAQYQNPVMNVKLKITRFCNWLQSLRLYFWLEVFR